MSLRTNDMLTCTIGAAAERLPVVFVPGTAGSQLSAPQADGTTKPLWLSMRLIDPAPGGIDLAALGPDGRDGSTRLVADGLLSDLRFRVRLDLRSTFELLDAGGTPIESRSNLPLGLVYSPKPQPIYSRFVDWARNQWLVDQKLWYEVPYDWRKGACDENSAAIDAKVEQALQTTGAKQVVLIAHSLGGLVCRDYISRSDNARKVRALIAVGTPWLGAPKAGRGLRWGYNFGLGGKLEPMSEHQIKGIYIWSTDLDRKDAEQRRYLTLVSLLDPNRTKAVARTFPCVFQQLPAEPFMELYGRALGREPTSPFAEDKTAADAIAVYKEANPGLYGKADEWRAAIFQGGSRGVRHYLIAATLDPEVDKDSPELSMDMRFAREGDPVLSWYSKEIGFLKPEPKAGGALGLLNQFGEKTKELFGTTKELLELMAPEKARWEAFTKKLLDRDAQWRETLGAFFDINPFLRDMGNRNWHLIRQRVFEAANSRDPRFKLFPEVAIPVHSGSEWGDGTAPLLSATAGAQLRAEGTIDLSEAKRRLGEETVVNVVSLGKVTVEEDSVSYELTVRDRKVDHKQVPTKKLRTVYREHSAMLDDLGVRQLISENYEQAIMAPTP